MKEIIRIGTRGSQLALYQAELAKAQLNRIYPLLAVEIVKIKTSGDMIRRRKAAPFDTKRIFTREIEEALLGGEVDLAVHSAKDLAVFLPDGLGIGAVLEREDPRDCVVGRDGKKLADLPAGATIGTSSLRRKMQILRLYPDLCVRDLHGNVDSRVRKVREGVIDAAVLAYAGVKRLGLVNHVSEILEPDRFYPAAGQGVIVIQTRADDAEVNGMLESLNHPVTAGQLQCERAFLACLEGGCQLPCGIMTVTGDDVLRARGAVFAVEGRSGAEAEYEGPAGQPAVAGEKLAGLILEAGGREILEGVRRFFGKKPERHG